MSIAKNQAEPGLINIDWMINELPVEDRKTATIDVCIAALAFKHFDEVPKRLPFLIECTTKNPNTWEAIPLQGRQWFGTRSATMRSKCWL